MALRIDTVAMTDVTFYPILKAIVNHVTLISNFEQK
jgi:hypothetical protein